MYRQEKANLPKVKIAAGAVRRVRTISSAHHAQPAGSVRHARRIKSVHRARPARVGHQDHRAAAGPNPIITVFRRDPARHRSP
jgi:hypothetical protein